MSEQHLDIKLLEIRDKATFMPMFAFTTASDLSEQNYLLRRAGFSPDSDLVMFGYLEGNSKAEYDPYSWGDRTKKVAHDYIQNNWHKIKNGDVIDVEFILGETEKPKTSERNEVYV